LVDHWAANEQLRLNWIRANQRAIRAECYQGLIDAVCNNQDPAQVGHRIILPSSHPGSTHNMLQLFQDSMAITCFFGFASYFVTVTANPQWPEIQAALEPGQQASDRPDIVCRVFHQKLRAFLKDLEKLPLFGKTIARVHVIEFQKRGLPHAHILIWVENEHQPRDSDQIDAVIRAEIPDPETEPVLYALVVQCMIHACDPKRCLDDHGHCRKGFPKPFNESTTLDEGGYPSYHHRNNGRIVEKAGKQLSNRHVVPYNPHLLLHLGCHVNVEFCSNMYAGEL
jgi:Helitron helicase-like domain at N-terminus